MIIFKVIWSFAATFNWRRDSTRYTNSFDFELQIRRQRRFRYVLENRQGIAKTIFPKTSSGTHARQQTQRLYVIIILRRRKIVPIGPLAKYPTKRRTVLPVWTLINTKTIIIQIFRFTILKYKIPLLYICTRVWCARANDFTLFSIVIYGFVWCEV